MSLPLLDWPEDAPPGGSGGGCALPVEATMVPRSEAMLSRSCNTELLVDDMPLPDAAVVPLEAVVDALVLVAADEPPVRLAISDCRSANIDARPVPPGVAGVSSSDPTVCAVEPLPPVEPIPVAEPLPLAKPLPPAAPLPLAEIKAAAKHHQHETHVARQR